MWFFLGSIELSSNVKPVWVGLKIKGAEITQFSTPLLNCHTCPKKHIQRFENTLFLPPPMAIVDPLKKKHIPPPKHTHTHTTEKNKNKKQQPLSSEVVAIFLNLAVCRLDISWKSSSFWDRCVASNVSWGFFPGKISLFPEVFCWILDGSQGNMSWFGLVFGTYYVKCAICHITKNGGALGSFWYLSSQVPKHERYICHSFVAYRRIYKFQGVIQIPQNRVGSEVESWKFLWRMF